MSVQPDPAEFKRTQREAWSLSAIGWNRWWRVFEDGAQVVNDELCDLARLRAGQRVLDLASGLGEPSFTAGRRVGARGSVLGVDLAPQMVAFARERALERGAANVRFEEGDGEDLQVEPLSFDAAVSRWGLMLMPEPVRAARCVRRALKPGSFFAAAVWSSPDEVPFIAVPQRVAERELGLPPPDATTPGPLRMGREGLLERCLLDAGFTGIESRVVPLTIRFASVAELVTFQREMSGTLKRALESAPPDVQERTWGVFAKAAEPFVGADGVVRFDNRCRLAVGVA
jgi:ubiquinone/menaquinone biosynthesis C-methylase UbiE